MSTKSNKTLIPLAKDLRKAMTKEERRLWYVFLRGYPVRFYRQKVIGQYIVDFYCSKAKLVIEIDGSQHYREEEKEKDKERTQYLEKFGVFVLRFSNVQINREFSSVCEYIHQVVEERIDRIPPFNSLP